MTPEPGHRARKRYNETRPLTIRVGAIRDELDARSDGTEAGYRAVIMRDLKRYYQLLQDEQIRPHSLEMAQRIYFQWWAEEQEDIIREHIMVAPGDYASMAGAMYLIDACERAAILVTHAGLTVDAALVAVGLVKEEK